MKISVADIDKKVADAAEKKNQLKAESKQADSRKLDLDKQSTAAAEAGDLELYRALKKQAASIEEESFVRAAQLGKLQNPVSEDEVLSAWKDYTTTYNKTMSAHLAELEKKKNAFLDEYETLVKMQGEALVIRERLAGYLGEEFAKTVDSRMGMEVIPFNPQFERPPVTDYMASFYLSQRKGERREGYLMVDPVTERVVSVVANRKASV